MRSCRPAAPWLDNAVPKQRHPWILVSHGLSTEGKLTPEERGLLSADSELFQSAESRRATRLLWLRLLLDRPEPLTDREFVVISEALERFGRGGPVPIETLRDIASYYTEEIAPRTTPGRTNAVKACPNSCRCAPHFAGWPTVVSFFVSADSPRRNSTSLCDRRRHVAWQAVAEAHTGPFNARSKLLPRGCRPRFVPLHLPCRRV